MPALMQTLKIKNPVAAILSRRSHDVMQQQQIITYVIAVGLATMGMTLHLCHAYGSSAPALRLLSMSVLVVCVPTFVLWLKRKVRVTTAFGVTAIFVQVTVMLKIMYIALCMPRANYYLIMLNGVVSMAIMILLEISYLRISCVIVGISNLAVLIFVGSVINNNVLWQTVTLIALFTVFFIFMGDLMYRNVRRIQSENIRYHADELLLLRTLRLNRQEIEAYISICRKNPDDKKGIDKLFGMLSEEAQRNIINAARQRLEAIASEESRVKAAFPSFTPMELTVARLVMSNMKLSQIIALTGKSESNISVVRSRIRKKLNLRPGEDLREALMQAVGH